MKNKTRKLEHNNHPHLQGTENIAGHWEWGDRVYHYDADVMIGDSNKAEPTNIVSIPKEIPN